MNTDATFYKLQKLVSTAKEMTNQGIKQYPKYPPYRHAQEQLDEIERYVKNRKVPTQEERKHIDIGIMAFKEFEPREPEYAKLLMEIATLYDSL
jgi:Tsi6